MTDKELIDNIKKKDEESLGKLISKYGGYVSAVLFRVSGGYLSKEDLEEAAADVFVALWKNVWRIDTSKTDCRPWLAKTARNMAISRFRKEQHTPEREAVPLHEDIILFEKDITDEVAVRREQEEILNNAVGALGQPEREIFMRFYFLNEKIQEIAKELDMQPATVKTKLHRSRKKLQEAFEERGYWYEG